MYEKYAKQNSLIQAVCATAGTGDKNKYKVTVA